MWSSHLYLSLHDIIKRAERGRWVWAVFWVSDMLCYISTMTNQTVSVVEEWKGESLDEQQQTRL